MANRQVSLDSRTNLTRFVGGQMSAHRAGQGNRFRGQIRAITLERVGTHLICSVWFDWSASSDDNRTWHMDTVESQAFNASLYTAQDLGQGRLRLYCDRDRETIILYPKGDSEALDPALIRRP